MDTTESDPFKAHADWQHNACIDNFMQFAELADCFVRSGDTLVSSALSDHMLLDVHVHSICFLYRHGLELTLKDLIWKSHYVVTGTKRFAQDDWQELGRHRLRDLWGSAGENARQILGADFPLNPDEARQLENLFAQFEQHDPDSYSFRYPISKKKGRTHPSLVHVNLRVLHENVHQAFDRLKTLGGLIDYFYEQRSEREGSE